MKYVQLHIAVKDWQIIDAVIDNSIAVDVVEGEVVTAMRGSVVRDAGWPASFHKGGDRFEYGWQPGNVILEIEVSGDHWAFVLEQLERWRQVDDTPGLAAVTAKVRSALNS